MAGKRKWLVHSRAAEQMGIKILGGGAYLAFPAVILVDVLKVVAFAARDKGTSYDHKNEPEIRTLRFCLVRASARWRLPVDSDVEVSYKHSQTRP